MTRIAPIKLYLMNLNQEISEDNMAYLGQEEAYQKLKKLTGKDFGYDVQAWKKWIRENGVSMKYPKGRLSKEA